MKDLNIRQELEPVIVNFEESLQSIKRDIIEKREAVSKELQVARENTNLFKDNDRQAKKNHEEELKKLRTEIERYKTLQSRLQEEINRYDSLKQEVSKIKLEESNKLKGAEGERALAEGERRKLEIAIKEYKMKCDSLKNETDHIEQRRMKAAEHERTNKIKEKALIREDERIAGENSKLAIREIDVKGKEKQIELEIKRNNLNG